MPTVKILVVADDNGGFQRLNSKYFHVGEFVKVLADTDWDGFDVQITKAHRNSAASAADAMADLYDFRFSDASLAGFDMAFFFSIYTISEETSYLGTSDTTRKEEAAALARFMEAGKGYFAAGDHEDLGSAVNMHVPRIRSMRRWIFGGANPYGLPAAPSGTGADRHDTLRAGTDSGTLGSTVYAYQFNDQSDAIPQIIRPRRYQVHKSRYFRSTLPHPLLCSPLGTINVLPDHMHEGWCEEPSDLTQDEGLPGRAGKKEYPPLDGAPFGPEVIAWGHIEPHATYNQEFGAPYTTSPMTTTTTDFGQICAYDGHRVGLGRAVCDSTWHHFVNINVIGTDRNFPGMNPDKAVGFYNGPGGAAVPDYEKIKHYFRNLVYWMIPAGRRRKFWDLSVAAIRRHPRWEEFKTGLFAEKYTLDYIYGLAQLAEHYFTTTRGYCYAFQLLPIVLEPIWKPDFTIWEHWLPELDPWSPRVQRLKAEEPVEDQWLSRLMPDADLGRQLLLGTVVYATLRHQARAKSRKDDAKGEKELAKSIQSLLAENVARFTKAASGVAREQKAALEKIAALAGR